MSKDRYSDDYIVELFGADKVYTIDSPNIMLDAPAATATTAFSSADASLLGSMSGGSIHFGGTCLFDSDFVGINGGFQVEGTTSLYGENIRIGHISHSVSEIIFYPKDGEGGTPVTINGDLHVTGSIAGSLSYSDIDEPTGSLVWEMTSFSLDLSNSFNVSVGDSGFSVETNFINIGPVGSDGPISMFPGEGLFQVFGWETSGYNHVCAMVNTSDGTDSGDDVLKLMVARDTSSSFSKYIRFTYNSQNTSDRAAGTEAGSVQGNDAGGVWFLSAFTGCHPSVMTSNPYVEIGMIAESTGEIWALADGDNISTAIPKVQCSDENNSVKVYGVFSDINLTNGDYEGYYVKHGKLPGESSVIVNSIGEGQVLVTNYNGEISNGDYIASSEVTGYGMKQDDDILHNYTVAKCVEEIDWASVTDLVEHNGIEYKKYLAGCTYHCG